MKLLIVSEIHGNCPELEAVIRAVVGRGGSGGKSFTIAAQA